MNNTHLTEIAENKIELSKSYIIKKRVRSDVIRKKIINSFRKYLKKSFKNCFISKKAFSLSLNNETPKFNKAPTQTQIYKLEILKNNINRTIFEYLEIYEFALQCSVDISLVIKPKKKQMFSDFGNITFREYYKNYFLNSTDFKELTENDTSIKEYATNLISYVENTKLKNYRILS